MKGDFVIKFIEALADYGSSMCDVWREMPHYYKGFHVSGPKFKRSYTGFKNLERRKIIRIEGKKYKFTKYGRNWLQITKIKYFHIKNNEWDGKWRLVLFDIPQTMNLERDWLRRKFNNLGFYMLQKSVFVYPYPCETEIGELCSNADVLDYVDIIIANSLGKQERVIRKYFKI